MSEPTDVLLNVVNHSNESGNIDFVIFQQNVSESFDLPSIAWMVIKGLDPGEHHPMEFEWQTQINISDANGNFTPEMASKPGDRYVVESSGAGERVIQAGSASGKDVIEIVNGLPSDSIGAHCYRSGKLLSSHNFLEPTKQAEFMFKPTIFIGAVSQLEEGQPIPKEVAEQIKTQFDLKDLISADIVITGGGTGGNARKITFSLENVKKRS